MPVEPREARRARMVGWATFLLVAVMIGLLAYLGYAAFEGSDQLVHPDHSRVCRLPSALGWEYQAINYDQASDAALAAEADPLACASVGEPAGTDLMAADGTRLAGWYIPAAAPIGAQGPTVVLVHGHGTNKNGILPWAEVLHADYNLVLFDQRNHGQSFGTETTVGVRERTDLEAVVAWLRTTHAPTNVAVLGNSMGAITATNAVALGLPVQALVLDSSPLSVASSAQRRIESQNFPLALPASWAVVLGALFRTGVDVTAADPIINIDDVGSVPVLILQGDADLAIDPTSADQLAAAATEAGVRAEVHICAGAGHSRLLEVCPDDYRAWVLGFLAQTLSP
ncbi:MAG TPA: alpha/beta fold hydrolase [Pleomorphomonadaceae bacterium]|nr:alpha/beta fold hydrolase [Pleomorphomonadaceae bacterium]